jgi:hypothetical protein
MSGRRVVDVRITRRGVQIALGGFWLLDGALQLQPYMLSKGFALGIIAPTAVGQPSPVYAAVHLSALVIASHPVLMDVPFALVQLGLGIGLLWPRTVRLALIASVFWAGGVWLFGEGLGGVAAGNSCLLSGAPGAAALYALLALAAWPWRSSSAAPARWLPRAWAVLWVGLAALQLLPAQLSGRNLSGDLTANTADVPSLLTSPTRSLATLLGHHPVPAAVLLALAELAIGLSALRAGRLRTWAASAGAALALLVWIFAEGFGGLATGQATDPNTGPLLVLLAAAMWASGRPSAVAVPAYPPSVDLRVQTRLAA